MNWKNIVVTSDKSILEVLKIIDEGAMQIALVVDENYRLVGTVTDGDVRRGILKGVSLETPVHQIMNQKPTVALNSKPHSEYLEKMKEMELLQLPVVDDTNKLIGVRFLKEIVSQIDSSNPVVLMAGGIGERLKPLTDHLPKPMLEIGGKPILENIIEDFSFHGFKDFIISVNYKKETIEDYFGDGSNFGVNISYIRERKKLGTAGALSLMRDRLTKPFFVMNADLLTGVNFRQLLTFHKDHAAVGTMCVRKHEIKVPFGVIDIDGYKISGIKEKPVNNYYVNAGIYVLEPEALEYIKDDTVLDMPALFQNIMNQGQLTVAFALREDWMDVGTPDDFKKAEKEFPFPARISTPVSFAP